jgi:hypothetical protein
MPDAMPWTYIHGSRGAVSPSYSASLFEAGAIEHRDMATRVAYEARMLQFERRFGDTFATHAQHIGNQFLGHHELVSTQSIQAKRWRWSGNIRGIA